MKGSFALLLARVASTNKFIERSSKVLCGLTSTLGLLAALVVIVPCWPQARVAYSLHDVSLLWAPRDIRSRPVSAVISLDSPHNPRRRERVPHHRIAAVHTSKDPISIFWAEMEASPRHCSWTNQVRLQALEHSPMVLILEQCDPALDQFLRSHPTCRPTPLSRPANLGPPLQTARRAFCVLDHLYVGSCPRLVPHHEARGQ